MTINPIRHLSSSMIASYLQCPIACLGGRVFGWGEGEQKNGLPMALGRAVHLALTAYHRGGDPELRLLDAINGKGANAGHGIRDQVPSAQLTMLLRLLGRYQELYDPEPGDVAAVWFEVAIPDVPIPLVGEYDLVRARTVWDWKTSAWPKYWDQAKADAEQQATAYHYSYHAQHGELPQAMTYVILATGGPQTGAVTTLSTTRTADDLVVFEALCQSVWHGLLTAPLTPSCPAGKCPYPERCARLTGPLLGKLTATYQAFQADPGAEGKRELAAVLREVEGGDR